MPCDALHDARDLVREMDIDDRRAVFRRGPAPEFAAGDLQDLEPGEDVVIDVGAKREIKPGLNCKLLDFRRTEGRHVEEAPK